MSKEKWYNGLLLIADFIPPNPSDFEKFNVGEQVKRINELGFNSQHIEASDITVGEAGEFYFHSDSAVHQKNDLLREYCDGYKHIGNNAIIYFNVHWLAENLCTLKPDWYQRDESGKKILIGYGSGGVSCINSPFREWAFSALKDLGKYAIKGIFLDGPFFDSKGCYCESCLSKFENRYGFRYTPENLKQIDIYRKLLEFRKDSICEFIKEARAALKSTNPEALIYINSIQIGPDIDGRNNNLTIKWQDALLAEGGFFYTDLRTTPIWKPAATAKLLESQADGKPCIVAIAGRLGPWSRYLLPPAEKWLIAAETVANGSNIWYGIYDSNRNDERMKTVKDINTFLSSNSEYLSGTESTAKIAVVWSFKNADFYQTTTEFVDFTGQSSDIGNNMKSDARKAFNGWCEVLHRSHRVFDIIDDFYLTEKDITKYELLILPGIACVSEEEAETIREFVANGGSVITTFDTSYYNECGMCRKELALGDVLGILSADGVEQLPNDHVEIEKSMYTNGIDQQLIPAPHLHIKTVPAQGCESFMNYREKQPARYCDLPPKTKYPFMLVNRYKSGKAAMFTGNIDVAYEDYCLPEYFKLMSNMVDSLCRREIFMDEEITSLDINIRKNGDTSIVHLINHTSHSGRPISNVIPLGGTKLSFYTGKRPDTVRALRQGKMLEFGYDNGFVSVVIPEIKEYEIVVCR